MRGVSVVATIAVGLVLSGCGSEQTVAPAATGAPTTAAVTTQATTTVPSTMATTAPATMPATTVPVTVPAGTDAPAGIDGAWRAVSGTVDGVPVDLVGEITLTIEGTQFSGVAACNSYEYTAAIDGDAVTFVEGFVTEIGCEPGLTELEATYLGSIGPTATVALDGAALNLTSPTAAWVFEVVPPTPLQPFVGTRWVLSEQFGEFGVSSTIGMEEGYVIFSDDGGVTGSTGCRPFAGTWTERSGVVQADVVPDGECSGLLVEVDEAMLAVLSAGFVPQIDANHLVAGVDGAGVGFFAG